MPATLQIDRIATSKGVKISHIVRDTNTSPDVLNRYWHNTAHQIDLKVLSRIATYLGVKVTDLIADEK